MSTTALLLPYQRTWVADRSPVKVCVKSRQIGITWATAYEAVEVASAIDGMDFWYQTVSADDAREFIEDAAMWARVFETACTPETQTLDDDAAREWYMLPEGERSIKVTSIRFRSGHRVSSIAHSPRKLRGKRGVLCLDEAAYHDNLDAILKAGHAFRVWGGRLIFISTQDTLENPFNQLVERIDAGKASSRVYSLHSVTLHNAIDDGLYKRICEVAGREWTPQSELAFVTDLLTSDGADSEFLCKPMRSGGQYIPTECVQRCMVDGHTVARWREANDFLHLPDAVKAARVDTFYNTEIKPRLAKLDKSLPHYMGGDFGRVSDLSVWAIGELDGARLVAPLLIELTNIPYEQQSQLFLLVANALPRLGFIALDGAGNGAPLGELALTRFGVTLAESVKASDAWYAAVVPTLRARFQDGSIEIPRDVDVQGDLAMFELIDGVPKLPSTRRRAQRSSAPRKELRHGDAAIALAMLSYATQHSVFQTTYKKIAKRGGLFAHEGAGIA